MTAASTLIRPRGEAPAPTLPPPAFEHAGEQEQEVPEREREILSELRLATRQLERATRDWATDHGRLDVLERQATEALYRAGASGERAEDLAAKLVEYREETAEAVGEIRADVRAMTALVQSLVDRRPVVDRLADTGLGRLLLIAAIGSACLALVPLGIWAAIRVYLIATGAV